MATLKSITAYEGRLILEYSGGAEGEPASRFVIANPPEDPLPAGNSLNEAKRVIDGLGGKSTSQPLVPKELGGSPASDESRTAPLQACPPIRAKSGRF